MSLPFTATISAQPGPQTEFLRSPADICIYGGAAGGGKTVGLILEPLRHVGRVANFTAVFFRRTTPQITNPGGLWDESQTFYPRLGGTPHLGMREWRWPRAGKIKFSHLQFETTVYDWQGAQIALICFDELTHFTAHQFFYMVSRNPLDLRRTALHPRDVQPGRRQLGRRLPGVVDRPGERTSDPRARRRSALLRPRLGKDRLGRSARGVDATPAAAGGSATGPRPAASDQRHVHSRDRVGQPGSAAGQPRIFHLAAVTAAARAGAAAGRQLEDPAGRRALFQA